MFANCSNDSRSPQVCLDCQRNVFRLHAVGAQESCSVSRLLLTSRSSRENNAFTAAKRDNP